MQNRWTELKRSTRKMQVLLTNIGKKFKPAIIHPLQNIWEDTDAVEIVSLTLQNHSPPRLSLDAEQT